MVWKGNLAKFEKEQNLRKQRSHTHQIWFPHQPILACIFEPILFFESHGCPWSEGKFWLFWKETKKGQNLRNWRIYTHQIWFSCISRQPLLPCIFWANSILWPQGVCSHGPKGKFEGKQNGVKSPKPERPHPLMSLNKNNTKANTKTFWTKTLKLWVILNLWALLKQHWTSVTCGFSFLSTHPSPIFSLYVLNFLFQIFLTCQIWWKHCTGSLIVCLIWIIVFLRD